jgi:hypothetical protein
MAKIRWQDKFKAMGIRCPICHSSHIEPACSEPEKDIYCNDCHTWLRLPATIDVIVAGMAEVNIL